MNHVTMSIEYRESLLQSYVERLGLLNCINGRNDDTRKLLICAANSFENVRSNRVIQLHPLGNHLNFNDGRKCVGATSF